MAQFLENLMTASFHGSVVILAVILLRLMLRKTPKKYICLLWLLAGIRLLMPIEIRSDLSLQPEPEPIMQQMARYEPVEIIPDMEVTDNAPAVIPEDVLPVFTPTTSAAGNVSAWEGEPTPEADTKMDWAALAPWIWFYVASLFLVYTLYSYVRLRLLVREAVKIEGGWESDRIETAFILGFIRPQIYIPMGLSPMVRRHILAHERTHLDKGDHWFKMIGFIALSLHWFNPLVWVAYILLCKDIEMACDERVVQFMELPERKEYSYALLNCSTNRAHFAACPVAFGEVSVKTRIQSVLRYRKPSFWISLAGVIAIVFVAVCLVTSPAKETDEASVSADAVVVSNVDELLAAIAPDTEIILEAGVYNLCEAKTYGEDNPSDYYTWAGSYDGFELVLRNVDNLTIRGSGRLSTTIETDPRWANVLRVQNSSGLILEDFTAGHTREQGECSGGVLFLEGCQDVEMEDLGLYGCGVVGLTARLCTNVTLQSSELYECSSSAVSLHTSTNVTVTNCRVYDIGLDEFGGYAFLEMADSQNVVVDNCEFSGSTLTNLLVAANTQAVLRENLFTGNRIRGGAFAINGQNVVLEGNKFESNSIRSWYSGYGNIAFDAQGNPISEADLKDQYPADPMVPTQPQLQIHVSTVDELIAAIGPNKEIILEGQMYDFSTATGYGTSSGDYYYWEDVFDGPGLVIRNVDNMTIRSSDGNVKNHTLSAVPRYADVLAFSACSNVTLSGFTAGHTIEPGSCAGGVIEFRDCDNMKVDNCGLYGCGILGVYAEYSQNIHVTNCDIYECSLGGIQMRSTNFITISGNTFRDLGGEETSFSNCTNITLDGQLLNPQANVQPINPDEDAVVADEEDIVNLGHVVTAFADAMFRGDEATMRLHLASTYDLPLVIPEGVSGAVLSNEPTLPPNYAADMESQGYCTILAYYTLDNQESGIYSPEVLTLEMCREQGIWKIRYFTTGMTEIDKLDSDLNNFFYAYVNQDVDMLNLYLYDAYQGTVPVYQGDSGSVSLDETYTVGDTFTNAELARLNSYSAAIPFKTSPDSDTYVYLNVALQRRQRSENATLVESEWVVVDYGMEPGALISTPELTDGIRIEFLEEENYTGVVMLIDDPSRVFLGTSTQQTFSPDTPGKRINEMFDVYPNALAAVNASAFFDDGTDSMAVGSYPLGLVVSRGDVRTSEAGAMVVPGMEGFAGFTSDNVLVVGDHNLSEAEAKRLGIRDGCSIGPALIIDMEVQPAADVNSGYAPRTAIGQTADGTVILLCINGRVFNSLGATYADVANEMMRYGAVNACMMQGGSATGMMYRDHPASIPQLYTSIHSASGDQELAPRRLPTYWMVAAE